MESDLSVEYRERVFRASAALVGKIVWVCIALALFFVLFDFLLLADRQVVYGLFAVRIALVAGLVVISWKLHRCSTLAQYDRLCIILIAAIEIALLAANSTRPEYHHYLVDILWIFGAYSLLQLPLLRLAIPLLIFSALNLSINLFLRRLVWNEMTLGVVMTVLANLLGFLNARRLLHLGIAQVRLNRQLESEKHEVQTQNRINQTLMSMIAHDLRAPIGNLAASLEYVLTLDDAATKELLLTTMASDFKQVYSTFDNMLLWARGLRGKLRPNPERFDVAKAVAEEVRLLASQARVKGIALTCDIADGTVLEWDQQMFRACARNLLSNAYKFSLEGGKVRLLVRADGEGVARELTVEDHGKGIPEDKRHELFQEFSVAEHGSQRETGFGMGLYLCRLMVEANGGQIRCDSDPGQRTLFTIRLAGEAAVANP
jgi:signal transduction histidine kinase